MSENFKVNGEQNKNDLNEIIEDIYKKHKEIIEKLKSQFNNVNDEKRKYKLNMLAILYRTYLSTFGTIGEKDFTNEDLNLIKSLISDEENEKDNNFVPIINSLENSNFNLLESDSNQELFEANLLKLEKKKSDLKISSEIKKREEKKEEEKININTCIFCTEEFEENDITNPQIMECKKYVHGNCFINYIEEELNNNRFPIRCPLCPGQERHEINYKTIIDCLLLNDKDNLAAKLENISLNHLAEHNSDEVTFCPTAGCNYMCFYDKNEFVLNCPLCKKSYCLQCKTEWHKDLTCEQYQQQKRENNKDENDIKFEEYVKGSRLKQCPKCKRWVEKIDGCDHIQCTCGAAFCYRCGKIKDSPFDHGCRHCGTNLFNFGLGNVPYLNNNGMGLFNNNQGLFNNNYLRNYYQGGLFGFNNNNNPFIFNNQNNGFGMFGNNRNNQNFNLFPFNNNNNNLNPNNNLFGNFNNVQRGGLLTNIYNNNNNNQPLFGNNFNNGRNNNNNNNQPLFGNNNNFNFGRNNNNKNNNNNNAKFGTNNNNQN